ncbi:hypothetical protein [Ochrovirga pacifica]|uniref:hypothetical protein n=1 Tax=Ochrovirga pacifica TaxID=1042376 RepID=UPI000255A058|nr:hypothetical protein [Ochrovirga pacifica]
MKEVDLIIERLNDIEKYNGIWGVVITISLVVGFILIWKYLTKSIETKAVHSYNESLELLKADLQEKIALKLSSQKAEFSKEIARYTSDLDKDLSKLSSELAISNSKQIEVHNEERKAIIEYLNAYSELLYGALEVKILDYKYNNHEDINSKLLEINKAYSKNSIAWNKLKFWTTNRDLISITHKLNTKILELSHYTQAKLDILRYNLTWGKMYTDSFIRITKDKDTIYETAQMLAEEDKKIRKENEILVKEYHEGKLKIWSEVMEINHTFQDIAKKYLNEIQEKANA